MSNPFTFFDHDVDGDSVTIQRSGKPSVAVRSPKKLPLRWIASVDDVAYFVNELSEVEAGRGDFFVSPVILRFSVTNNKWLEPLWLGNREAEKEPDTKTLLGGVVSSPSGLLVLSYAVRVQAHELFKNAKKYETRHYDVSLFPTDSMKPKWSKRYAWQGDPSRFPTPTFVGKSARLVKEHQIETLNLIPETGDIVVCAGKTQDVVCLYPDGSEAWRIARVWEFQRGFIGPSVFEHFMSRFGVDEWDDSTETAARIRSTLESRKKTFYERYGVAITAGPVIVPHREKWRGHSVILAVAVQPKDMEGFGRTLADGLIYEIADGELQGMTTLPRPVVGRPRHISAGTLVWGCERGCMARLGTSGTDLSRGFTFSGDDMLCRVAWYREIPWQMPNAWFTVDPEDGVYCSSEKVLFRTIGAFVREADEEVYSFQISAVDLRDGIETTLTLEVPFKGKINIPKDEVSSINDRYVAHRPHLLRISELHEENGRLRLTLEHTANDSVAVEFDISSLSDSWNPPQAAK
ncbi:hypothetical protein ACFL2H_03160 [Planctomycetota bacterium]